MNCSKWPYRAALVATIGFLTIAIILLAFHAKASQYDCHGGAGYLGKATKMSEYRAQHGGVWHVVPAITFPPQRPVARTLPRQVEQAPPRPAIVLAFRFRPPPQLL